MSPSPTTSFNYKGNNMDITDIRILKREVEAAIAESINDFMRKTKSRVLKVDLYSSEITSLNSPCREYRVQEVTLDVRV